MWIEKRTELKVCACATFLEETEVELGVVPATEGGAVRDEDVAAHRRDGRVVADDVAQVPRLKKNEFITKQISHAKVKCDIHATSDHLDI